MKLLIGMLENQLPTIVVFKPMLEFTNIFVDVLCIWLTIFYVRTCTELKL